MPSTKGNENHSVLNMWGFFFSGKVNWWHFAVSPARRRACTHLPVSLELCLFFVVVLFQIKSKYKKNICIGFSLNVFVPWISMCVYIFILFSTIFFYSCIPSRTHKCALRCYDLPCLSIYSYINVSLGK